MECSTAFKAWRDKSAMRVLKIRRAARPHSYPAQSVRDCLFSFSAIYHLYLTTLRRSITIINTYSLDTSILNTYDVNTVL